MENASSRLMAAVGCLALVSIASYWLYEPSGRDANALAPLPELDAPLPAARSGKEQVVHRVQPPSDPLPPAPLPQPERNPDPKPDVKPSIKPDPKPDSAQPIKGVIPPSFVDYTVKAGETFESIAKARYGSAKFHTAIARANPLKDPRRVRAGDVLRLPVDPSNIQGKPVEVMPDAQPKTTPTSPTIPADGPSTEYVVQSGDTLSGIARSVWGSTKNWRKILEANKSILPSEDKLRPGMKLRIPPKPAD